MKLAVTATGALMLLRLQVAPVQPPLKALNANPALVAVTLQVLLPAPRPGLGVQLTLPAAAGSTMTLMANWRGAVQLALLPVLLPLQAQVKLGMVVVTPVSLPAPQRLVLGAENVGTVWAVPHVPLMMGTNVAVTVQLRSLLTVVKLLTVGPVGLLAPQPPMPTLLALMLCVMKPGFGAAVQVAVVPPMTELGQESVPVPAGVALAVMV